MIFTILNKDVSLMCHKHNFHFVFLLWSSLTYSTVSMNVTTFLIAVGVWCE